MTNCPLIYVETDIPAGMTIREWKRRRARSAQRAKLLGLRLPARSRHRPAATGRLAVA